MSHHQVKNPNTPRTPAGEGSNPSSSPPILIEWPLSTESKHITSLRSRTAFNGKQRWVFFKLVLSTSQNAKLVAIHWHLSTTSKGTLSRWSKMDDYDDFQTSKVWHPEHFGDAAVPAMQLCVDQGPKTEVAARSSRTRARSADKGAFNLHWLAFPLTLQGLVVLSTAACTMLSRLRAVLHFKVRAVRFETSCCKLQQDGWTWDEFAQLSFFSKEIRSQSLAALRVESTSCWTVQASISKLARALHATGPR